MGGYITVGMRSESGDVKSALFYTNHLQDFVLDDGLARGQSTFVSRRIDELASDEEYGSYPVAPFGCGLRFFDFKTKSLIDSQNFADPVGVEFDVMVSSLINDDGKFARIVPFVGGMTQWVRQGVGGVSQKKTKIDPVQSVDALWEALGFRGLPGKFDFATLDLKLPDWKVSIYKRDLSGTEVMRAHLRRLGVLTPADEGAWPEYIDLRKQEGSRWPF
ncbi:hypothetical protein [Rhizobium sp. MHM7A]|uniref:hypothetical protein n=1 Tax=Rhizobium sp. MHM7A TaxID=2583233 RepID=UPI001105C27E|nr:hypothetical protein [Rhizobium sp. MHM7A]TLX15935.1 hypothetical protein FFR93_01060 [Rhizobium sp. MHM7A]